MFRRSKLSKIMAFIPRREDLRAHDSGQLDVQVGGQNEAYAYDL